MEASGEVVNCLENGSSGEGRPPNPLAAAYRQCFSGPRVAAAVAPCKKKSLVRHASLSNTASISIEPRLNIEDRATDYVPILRSGAWGDIGFRSSMEDAYVCVDDFIHDYGLKNVSDGPNAFYGVFDGHGGKDAANFACNHLPRFIVEDEDFPMEIERAVASAFLQTDTAFAEACLLDAALASGTTALAALVVGSSLIVANAGDCRAVLCRRGKAIEMSRDHKPGCSHERKRIEALGGYVSDGYLNGQLNVARALGDWHMEGLKGSRGGGPLSAEPELKTTRLTEEDEFLIIGCDGIWDVFMSQNAVDFARRRLQEHNDPVMCSKDVVEEALKRKSGDNLAVVVVCFQPQPPPNLVVPRSKVHRSFSAEGLKELQSFLDSLET
ncbi:probable protein phosphatase 2C 22 isoform X1 [Rhododendron vialii]|uniref:probable protein phosphatase 2C 22 isoform X1 n=1 Tax=Rhododendron vialii TaxID=182163 RepID=UPI002660460E|nr:probable protein phosphatase 2C 22 isoform X1 [Rhododendron vialii]